MPFLDRVTKAPSIRKKIDKLDLIKIKNFCSMMESVQRMKQQITDWDMYIILRLVNIAKPYLKKRLAPKIYKALLKLNNKKTQSSVQFSRSVMSDSLWPRESQHARPSCPSPTPGVYPNSCPSSRWCHPAISSSVVPFSSCPQSHPASESFPMSQLFTRGGQSTGVSAWASVLPMNTRTDLL